MAKKTLDTFKNLLGYDGKKRDDQKALEVLKEIGIDATNSLGETPLIIAAYLGRTEILEIIISQTNDVDFKIEGKGTETALIEACYQRRLESIKLLINAGAKLEQTDKYGLTPLAKIFTNTFSDPIPSAIFLISKGALITDRVIKLGLEWDKDKFTEFLKSIDYNLKNLPISDQGTTTQHKEPAIDTTIDIEHLHNVVNNKNYFETAKVIWKKLVPKSGQAPTVQGELLRAIEKLRDEAQRNGNGNFNAKCHGLLIKYLRQYLADEDLFGLAVSQSISDDLNRLTKKANPYLEDDLYNRIVDKIVDWYLKNPMQITHIKNDDLYC